MGWRADEHRKRCSVDRMDCALIGALCALSVVGLTSPSVPLLTQRRGMTTQPPSPQEEATRNRCSPKKGRMPVRMRSQTKRSTVEPLSFRRRGVWGEVILHLRPLIMAHERYYTKEAIKTMLCHPLPHRLLQPLKPNLCMEESSQAREQNGFLTGTVSVQHFGGQTQQKTSTAPGAADSRSQDLYASRCRRYRGLPGGSGLSTTGSSRHPTRRQCRCGS